MRLAATSAVEIKAWPTSPISKNQELAWGRFQTSLNPTLMMTSTTYKKAVLGKLHCTSRRLSQSAPNKLRRRKIIPCGVKPRYKSSHTKAIELRTETRRKANAPKREARP